jgi:phage recombination protein Bet
MSQAIERSKQTLPRATSGMSVDEALQVSGVDRAEFALLASTTFRHARSLEELATLIATTKRRGLDGMLRHVYFEQFGGSDSAPSLHVGIDGLRAIAAHTGRYGGALEAHFSGNWEMPIDERDASKTKTVPEKATCVVYAIVQGRSCAFEGTAYMEEAYPGPGARGRMWRQRPRGMLSIAAERQALRRAFPDDMAGIADIDDDEEVSPRRTVAQNDAEYVRIFGNGEERELPPARAACDPEVRRLYDQLRQRAVDLGLINKEDPEYDVPVDADEPSVVGRGKKLRTLLDRAHVPAGRQRAASEPAVAAPPAAPPVSDIGIEEETEEEAARRMEWEQEETKRQRAREGLL